MIKDLLKYAFGIGIGSQFGEDAILAKILPPKGFYVDIGAYHPFLYSNTYRLYQKGWHGIAIDPNPAMSSLFRFFRPRDTFLNIAIAPTDSVRTYYRFSDPAYNTLDHDSFAETCKKTYPHYIGTIGVPTKPLKSVLSSYYYIDFLNLDTEGSDLDVLKTHDWTIKPTVIAAEGDVAPFLVPLGYTPVSSTRRTTIYSLI